jgi:hypothetical protein
LTGISNTIVVNLGESNDENNNEEDDMGKNDAHNMPAQTTMPWETKTTNMMLVEISSETKKVLFAEK